MKAYYLDCYCKLHHDDSNERLQSIHLCLHWHNNSENSISKLTHVHYILNILYAHQALQILSRCPAFHIKKRDKSWVVDGPHLRLRYDIFYLPAHGYTGASLSDFRTALASACVFACLWRLTTTLNSIYVEHVKLYTTSVAVAVGPLTMRDCGVSYFPTFH